MNSKLLIPKLSYFVNCFVLFSFQCFSHCRPIQQAHLKRLLQEAFVLFLYTTLQVNGGANKYVKLSSALSVHEVVCQDVGVCNSVVIGDCSLPYLFMSFVNYF